MSIQTTEATTTEKVETVRYTADVIALTDDNHVLLIKRGWDPHKGAWALPGGHVDAGETSRDAAARELREETGVDFDPSHLWQLGIFDDPNRDPRGRYITAAYIAHVPNNTTATPGDDAVEARWFHINQLPDLAFDHAAIINAATARG
ncbi:NUDIX hydrolase [Streptomyces sp. sk226]|uniref:NUDIX domain-containing protein n=1 Tax=Streptomyces sp. sk226 TaxID=2034268 RepID=UPI000BF1DE1F|nr:NUDIX hydrolase [Streptomyces sp. sk226]